MRNLSELSPEQAALGVGSFVRAAVELSPRHGWFRSLLLLIFSVGLLLAGSGVVSAQTSHPRLPKTHRHPNLATENEAIPEFKLADTVIATITPRENLVTDSHRRYQAFTAADTQLFILDRKSGKAREIRGIPFTWRPFSNVVWTNDRTLMFDRWSSPHYGVHYAVDVARGKLLSALTFHDQSAESR